MCTTVCSFRDTDSTAVHDTNNTYIYRYSTTSIRPTASRYIALFKSILSSEFSGEI